MVIGIGTDLVEVTRFNVWTDFSEIKLMRIFSNIELAACKNSNGTYSAEKLAVRFAAKEAFYKALSQALFNLSYTDKTFSLLTICKMVVVDKNNIWQLPRLLVDWQAIALLVEQQLPCMQSYLSLTHEKTLAQAFVVLSI